MPTVRRSRVWKSITPSDSPIERDQVTRYYRMCLRSTVPRESSTYRWGLHHVPRARCHPTVSLNYRAPFSWGAQGFHCRGHHRPLLATCWDHNMAARGLYIYTTVTHVCKCVCRGVHRQEEVLGVLVCRLFP